MNRLIALAFCLALSIVSMANNENLVQQVNPTFWWAGMKQPELQVLLHGKNLAAYEPSLSAKDIKINRVVRPGNPNYLVLYLDVSTAQAQRFNIRLTKGNETCDVPYELRARKANAQVRHSFDAGDVIYLFVPDRFANGNPKNDVVAGMREKASNRKDPNGRHGGDLKGVNDHLDYFADLGVTALWMTPILENDMPSASYHGYACTDYYKVDPRFGTNEEYVNLVKAAHDKGLKVIMDFVFNHCGLENFLYRDMPSPSWFNYNGKYVQTKHAIGSIFDPHASAIDQKLSTDGWFVPSMPDFNGANPDVATYLIQNSIWWVEYAGIDGIRQDTYPYNNFDMMATWCRMLDYEYPGFNIVGESWLHSNVGVSMWQKDSRLSSPRNTYLPSVMDFPLLERMEKVFDDYKPSGSGLWPLYEYLSQDAVYANPLNLLIFLDNHDTSRFARNKKQAADTKRYQQALTFLLTTRGIPQLYYGDELGMYAAKFQGDGKLRADFPGGWEGDAINAFTPEGRSKMTNSQYEFARKLLRWRRGNDVIAHGSLVHYAPYDGVYVYARKYNGHTVTVLLNGKDQAVELPTADMQEAFPGTSAHDVISESTVTISSMLHLSPRGMMILEF